MWRETFRASSSARLSRISIHSLRVEGDRRAIDQKHLPADFNPLPPCGGRLFCLMLKSFDKTFQSTPSVWRETKDKTAAAVDAIFQSTPSVWRETIWKPKWHGCLQFQSTPSVWRETAYCATQTAYRFNFNPLPPCGGRLQAESYPYCGSQISIHSLRVEGDPFRLPILPNRQGISIHSLRVEGDFS